VLRPVPKRMREQPQRHSPPMNADERGYGEGNNNGGSLVNNHGERAALGRGGEFGKTGGRSVAVPLVPWVPSVPRDPCARAAGAVGESSRVERRPQDEGRGAWDVGWGARARPPSLVPRPSDVSPALLLCRRHRRPGQKVESRPQECGFPALRGSRLWLSLVPLLSTFYCSPALPPPPAAGAESRE
jgi:hypothetical protein